MFAYPRGPPGRTFPLVKFSYVTTALLSGPFPWTHLPETSSLSATFDDVVWTTNNGFMQSRKVFKVIQGGHIVNEIFLDELAGQAAEEKEKARQVFLNDTERRCAMLVKKPIIALRYKLPDGLNRRVQMTFLQEIEYNEVLHILRETGVYIKEKGDLPQEPACHQLQRPSTASTSTTYQSGTTAATSSTNGTAYSAITGLSSHSYGLPQHQRAFGSSEPNNTLVPPSRIFPRPSMTTSIVPGPSIPESIISRPNGWVNQTTDSQFTRPTAHGNESELRPYTTSVSAFPGPSQLISPERSEPARRSLFSNGPGSQNPNIRTTLAEYDHLMPPPKRKLPFPELPERREDDSREESVEPVSKKTRSNGTTAPNGSKSYNLRRKETELNLDPVKSNSTALSEPAVAKRTRKQTQGKAANNASALGDEGIKSRSKKSVKKDSPPAPASRKQPAKAAAICAPKGRAEASKAKNLGSRSPPKKEPSRKTPPAKKAASKSAAKTPTDAYNSTSTQTESSVIASKATQTHLLTMGTNTIYCSKSTQTDTPKKRTPGSSSKSKSPLATSSSNLVRSIETPSRTAPRRAPPVNKFARPRAAVNKFTPHPELAARHQARRGAADTSPTRRLPM